MTTTSPYARIEKELVEARRERDLAIAHDRQPYPTAWAYKQACKALEKHRQRADLLVDEIGKIRDLAYGYVHPTDNPTVAELIARVHRMACDAISEDKERRDRKPGGSAPIESPDDEDPERICHRCGGPNVHAWTAPSPLWNQVMRDGDINGPWKYNEIICPVCFAQLAEEQGIASFWRFYAERVHVELATTTPSGRVWNPQTWLWEDRSGPARLDGHSPGCQGAHTFEISCSQVAEIREREANNPNYCPKGRNGYHSFGSDEPDVLCAYGCGRRRGDLGEVRDVPAQHAQDGAPPVDADLGLSRPTEEG